MLNILARASVSRVTDPVGARLVRAGLTPNAMTIIGTVGTVASAVVFFPLNDLFVGSLLVTVFVLFDLLDGSMARTSGQVTKFGTVLDSSCDRIADGVLFASIAWWALVVVDDRITGAAALVSLVAAQVISYVKARAEAAGLDGDGGLVERAERFIIALIGTGLQGLGVPYAARVALLLLAVLAVITVAQRLLSVQRSARAPQPEPEPEPDSGDGAP
jgi:CDP-diacylglycerol--glycerol-3-phosphate 3-phosphatidyltransferase